VLSQGSEHPVLGGCPEGVAQPGSEHAPGVTGLCQLRAHALLQTLAEGGGGVSQEVLGSVSYP
jgi:hypothetical protein